MQSILIHISIDRGLLFPAVVYDMSHDMDPFESSYIHRNAINSRNVNSQSMSFSCQVVFYGSESQQMFILLPVVNIECVVSL